MHRLSKSSQQTHKRGLRTPLSTGLETARLLYGAAQLVAPRTVAQTARTETDQESLLVRRVLGARHLAQAALLIRGDSTAHRKGAVVDAAHASSMIAWAITHRRRRRAALLNALSATSFALGELLVSR